MARSKFGFFSTSQVFQAASNWGMRFGSIVIVAIIILAHFDIAFGAFKNNHEVYLFVVVVLLLFLSEILNEWRREMFSRLQTQSAALELIHQSMRSDAQLFTLEKSVEDLTARLKEVKPEQRVVIEHLGLDMNQAWEKVAEMVKDLPNITHLEYRLLMLSADGEDVSHFDDEVRAWLLSGRTRSTKISSELAELTNLAAKTNRTFTHELRTYAAMPLVHGLRVTAPFQASYVALCRWHGEDFNKYRWGGKEYRRILDASLSGPQSDLLAIFNGNFQHYWGRHTGVIQLGGAHQKVDPAVSHIAAPQPAKRH